MKNIKGFIKSKVVAQVLWAGYKSGQNVVLYGPGGYGKSAMAEAFLRQIGARRNQITIKALSVGTTLDDLLGGINIRVLKDTGEIFYNVEKSIFSTPYLILEEAFDAPTRVLEGLKDILTSREIRNGYQRYPIRTKFIIVATNRSKEELATDDSSKALMERFPLSLRVEWGRHYIEDYQELSKVVFGKQLPEPFEVILQYILKSIEEDESKRPPSPRTIVRALKVYEAAGMPALRFMDGLPNIERALDNFEAEMSRKRKIRQIQEAVRDYNKKIRRYKAEDKALTLSQLHELRDEAEILRKEIEKFELDEYVETI